MSWHDNDELPPMGTTHEQVSQSKTHYIAACGVKRGIGKDGPEITSFQASVNCPDCLTQRNTKPPPDSTLEENRLAIFKIVSTHENPKCFMNRMCDGCNSKVQALLSLYQKELVRELQPFTDLTDLANGTHSTPCQLCGEPSHRCNCDLALYYVERMAKNRLRGILEPIVIGVDEDTKPDLTGEQP